MFCGLVHSKWEDLVGERACPISFTDEEVRFAMQESREWNEAAEVLTTIRDTLGIDGEAGTILRITTVLRLATRNGGYKCSKKQRRRRRSEVGKYGRSKPMVTTPKHPQL